MHDHFEQLKHNRISMTARIAKPTTKWATKISILPEMFSRAQTSVLNGPQIPSFVPGAALFRSVVTPYQLLDQMMPLVTQKMGLRVNHHLS